MPNSKAANIDYIYLFMYSRHPWTTINLDVAGHDIWLEYKHIGKAND